MRKNRRLEDSLARVRNTLGERETTCAALQSQVPASSYTHTHTHAHKSLSLSLTLCLSLSVCSHFCSHLNTHPRSPTRWRRTGRPCKPPRPLPHGWRATCWQRTSRSRSCKGAVELGRRGLSLSVSLSLSLCPLSFPFTSSHTVTHSRMALVFPFCGLAGVIQCPPSPSEALKLERTGVVPHVLGGPRGEKAGPGEGEEKTMLEIVCGQRDRFRQRMEQLEGVGFVLG